jgi:hypothetical protein
LASQPATTTFPAAFLTNYIGAIHRQLLSVADVRDS